MAGLDVDAARVAALEAGRAEWDPEGRASFCTVEGMDLARTAGLFCIAVPTNVREGPRGAEVDDGHLRAVAETVARLIGRAGCDGAWWWKAPWPWA